MQLRELRYTNGMPVEGYGPGFFRLGGMIHHGPILVSPQSAMPWGGLDDLAPLMALADQIDVMLIGTGADIAPIPAGLRAALDSVGLWADPMSTAAACRTYNVLLAEARRVALAVLPVGGENVANPSD